MANDDDDVLLNFAPAPAAPARNAKAKPDPKARRRQPSSAAAKVTRRRHPQPVLTPEQQPNHHERQQLGSQTSAPRPRSSARAETVSATASPALGFANPPPTSSAAGASRKKTAPPPPRARPRPESQGERGAAPRGAGGASGGISGGGGGGGGGVISSLFTGQQIGSYRDRSRPEDDDDEEDDEDGRAATGEQNQHPRPPSARAGGDLAPSNAPRRGGKTFAQLGLGAALISRLSERLGVEPDAPTAIQSQAIPALLLAASSTSPFSPSPSSSSSSSSAVATSSARAAAAAATATAPASLARDVMVHAQTGSGKTLAYLLPLLQSLLPLSYEAQGWVDRRIGTLAIVLAPTRELARQIYDVAERILAGGLRARAAAADVGEGNGDGDGEHDDDQGASGHATTMTTGPAAEPSTRWLVPGLLCGGATRNHEKSRLRKGLPLLVCTPGRLLDHLQHTASLDVGRLQWLVLDEADKLLEMGFEDELRGILDALDGRWRMARESARQRMAERNVGLGGGGIRLGAGGVQGGATAAAAAAAEDEELEDEMGMRWWRAGRRRTVLVSATLDERVTQLAGQALRNPVVVRPAAAAAAANGTGASRPDGHSAKSSEGVVAPAADARPDDPRATPTPPPPAPPSQGLSAPSQLRQHYVVVPTKQRLVLLIALLRKTIAESRRRPSRVDASSGPGERGAAAGRRARSAKAGAEEARRILVFMSCTDVVDYFWHAFGGARMGTGGGAGDGNGEHAEAVGPSSLSSAPAPADDPRSTTAAAHETKRVGTPPGGQVGMSVTNELLPGASIFRLHGNMAQRDRVASLRGFVAVGAAGSAKEASRRGVRRRSGATAVGSGTDDAEDDDDDDDDEADADGRDEARGAAAARVAILFCTSVASRGLDLPQVSSVVQLDAPTDGGGAGVEEYLHRVGRTARAGGEGESWLCLLESERGYVEVLERGMRARSGGGGGGGGGGVMREVACRSVLKAGFGGSGSEFEARATDAQLAFERWLLADEADPNRLPLARRAYLSHLRAYATHPSSTKRHFRVALLQLGHLAKSFALREAPAEIKQRARLESAASAAKGTTAEERTRGMGERRGRDSKSARGGTREDEDDVGGEDNDAEEDEDEDEDEDVEEAGIEAAPPQTKEERDSIAKAVRMAMGGIGTRPKATSAQKTTTTTTTTSMTARGAKRSHHSDVDRRRDAKRPKPTTRAGVSRPTRAQAAVESRRTDAEARMYAKVREMGRQVRRKGVLADFGGASEFQIA